MTDELVPAAKAVAELQPAIEAFAEATGLTGPVRELAAWVTDLIRYRRAPHQANLLMATAEKIRASGLPVRAVEDKFLRAVLEDGAMEDDALMQERWANLLANAGTSRPSKPRIAFPKILAELDPDDAMLLDALVDRTSEEAFRVQNFPIEECRELAEGQTAGLSNLCRLGLLRFQRAMPTTMASISEEGARIVSVRITEFGWEFVRACRSPELHPA